ncbi:pyoverdine synthetase D [Pseudomonas fluorescens WH6]|nr:pyoverdine synthetase D [Pseudomonas fluorescens WH6]
MYRSGDLARWRADGAIDYLGRLDHQVKLRGLRIELGEIETVLVNHEAVREAVVVAQGDKLIGYWVGEACDEAALKFHLGQHVPDYMVPWRLMRLPAMPLSANGKLDRKQLLQVEAQVAATGYVEPRNDAERSLARIWSEVLGVERVGVTDDFFELGGHSLLATRLASQIRHQLGVQIHLGAVFDTPTIEALARHLEHIPAHTCEDEVDAMTQLLNELERIE